MTLQHIHLCLYWFLLYPRTTIPRIPHSQPFLHSLSQLLYITSLLSASIKSMHCLTVYAPLLCTEALSVHFNRRSRSTERDAPSLKAWTGPKRDTQRAARRQNLPPSHNPRLITFGSPAPSTDPAEKPLVWSVSAAAAGPVSRRLG